VAVLQHAVGAAFGSPVGCRRVDAHGNTLQPTTTGLAITRPDGMAIFATDEQHWALTDRGLVTWTGNWHNGLYSPVTSPVDLEQTQLAQTQLARISPMTLVSFDATQATAVMKEDASGSTLLVQTAGGCPDLPSAVGDHVFVRSNGVASDLVLVRHHETCAVATMHAADND
jgi:hypothetical protein